MLIQPPTSSYHRHWGILRKWGLTGNKRGPAASDGTPKTPKPVTNKRKLSAVKAESNASEEARGISDEPPAKKPKPVPRKPATVVKEENNDKKPVDGQGAVDNEDGNTKDEAK